MVLISSWAAIHLTGLLQHSCLLRSYRTTMKPEARLQVTVLTEHGLPPHRRGQLGQGALQRTEANLKLKPERETFLRDQQKDLHLLKKAATHKAQVREKELRRTPQHTASYPATDHQTTGKQTEKDCPSFQSQESTGAPQSSPLHGEISVPLQEITAEETTNYYTEDFTIESDITYNCINETIWI
ncbi:stathmin domain-containing protein 1 isoform X3 [Gallus gallus]|uniref:stathmin domain-containing protein 1 isoform X3 n=1 Tax=Gallus gallus TaxID=9031 RepID=UPI001AEB9AE1|nr:stathmin domain-containing protein 1 isoform X3 [Gallus gallus]